MKTMNLIKIAAVVLLGIAVSGKVQADNDKYSRTARVALGKMIHSVELAGEDICNKLLLLAQPVEDWMFESDYLSEESAGAVELWMLETDYLNEEVQPLESWMFDETNLSEASSENSLEPWMLDSNYLYDPHMSRSSVR
jgi:hypothetical protein